MKQYQYTVTTPFGKQLSGVIEASSSKEAKLQLRKRKYKIITLKNSSSDFLGLTRKVPDIVIVRFTRQLSVMLNSGLPLSQALEILVQQSESKTMSICLERIILDLKSGKSFFEALSAQKKIFNSLYVNMVRAGESSGTLGQILDRLSEYLERSNKIKRKIKGALVYPAIVVSVACVAIFVLLTYVVPTFASMYQNAGKDLPALTSFVIMLSKYLKEYFYLWIVCLLLSFFAFRRFKATNKGRYYSDTIQLHIPFVRDLIKKASIGRFCRNLSTLVKGGVSLVPALEICSMSANNAVIETIILTSLHDVTKGKSLSDSLSNNTLFPSMTLQMISVGEKVGELGVMLEKISLIYDDEVSDAVESLISVIEPVMIIVLGIIIGAVLIAMYLPMFNLMMILE